MGNQSSVMEMAPTMTVSSAITKTDEIAIIIILLFMVAGIILYITNRFSDFDTEKNQLFDYSILGLYSGALFFMVFWFFLSVLGTKAFQNIKNNVAKQERIGFMVAYGLASASSLLSVILQAFSITNSTKEEDYQMGAVISMSISFVLMFIIFGLGAVNKLQLITTTTKTMPGMSVV